MRVQLGVGDPWSRVGSIRFGEAGGRWGCPKGRVQRQLQEEMCSAHRCLRQTRMKDQVIWVKVQKWGEGLWRREMECVGRW